MLNKIRYLLYASGTYIKDATQKSIVIVKTFVEEIKARGIKEIFKEEWMDLIRLFFLKCGFASRLPIAVMRPIFSEMDDT